MQKKLIALALASLAGSAFAQSNVTVYGVMDGTFEFAKAAGASDGQPAFNDTTGAVTYTGKGSAAEVASRTRFSSNSSHIGFKGVEDLGNGLKALWQIETTVDFTDASSTNLASRDSFVGLTGNFGTVVGGNITHPIRAMGSKVDFNPGGSSSAYSAAITGEFAGVKTGTDERAKNAVAYVSPSFSGLTGTLAYVSGEAAKNSDQNAAGSYMSHQWQAAAQYENGPIYAGLGYHKAYNPQVLGAVTSGLLGFDATNSKLTSVDGVATAPISSYKDTLTAWRLAGKYTFSTGTSVSALYDQQKYSFDTTTTNNDAKRTAWTVGLNQNFLGKHNAYLQYSRAGKVKLNGDSIDQTSAHMWTVGYTYDLSKRTMLRAYYSEIRNQEGAKYDFYNNGVSPAYGADPKVVGFGLRHAF